MTGLGLGSVARELEDVQDGVEPIEDPTIIGSSPFFNKPSNSNELLKEESNWRLINEVPNEPIAMNSQVKTEPTEDGTTPNLFSRFRQAFKIKHGAAFKTKHETGWLSRYRLQERKRKFDTMNESKPEKPKKRKDALRKKTESTFQDEAEVIEQRLRGIRLEETGLSCEDAENEEMPCS